MKSNKSNIFVISGDFHQGKTTFAKQCVEHLTLNYGVGGFLSVSSYENNEVSYYTLINLLNKQSIRLCQTVETINWLKFRRFSFNPAAIEVGNRIIIDSIHLKSDVIFVDEIGPLELQGNAWAESLKLLIKTKVTQIWVIRRHLINELLTHLNVEPELIYDVEYNKNKDFFIHRIENSIKNLKLELANQDK